MGGALRMGTGLTVSVTRETTSRYGPSNDTIPDSNAGESDVLRLGIRRGADVSGPASSCGGYDAGLSLILGLARGVAVT